ncbi:unnamed protein product [Rotaria sp. Silwood1]|nr:unnamed protein product [Rotaria sp. Silwood1]
MTATRLEDLPNELWLELFVYFTWFELNSTWLQWKLNNRIQLLAQIAQNRVALSLSSMSFITYGEWLHYFEHEHPIIAHRITSLLLNESIISNEIISRWLENEKSFLPRIRKCTVYVDLINRYTRINIILLICRHALTLRHIVFYFSEIDRYYVIMKKVIEERISLHTMQFIMIKGKEMFFVEVADDRIFRVK